VPLDTTTLMARLPLTFASGTRKSLGSVRCAMHVRAVDGTTILCESNSSDATIVTTNDSQWAAAAGSLLHVGPVSRLRPRHAVAALCQRAAAHVHQREPRARAQERQCARAVAARRLVHSLALLSGPASAPTTTSVSAFWAWFGTTLAALRFQRPLGALWHGGLLYGLLTRVDVEQALSGQAEGVFVLRFSETNAGQLGVAYVGAGAQGTRVRHYLITPADVLGNKRTVCDFLMEQQQFQTLLLYGVDANGAPTFTPVAKRIAFKEFVKAARSAPDSSTRPMATNRSNEKM
jgi:hypothetical protein